MIQNLENNMELQINSLEARIEKMQEMFNKDLGPWGRKESDTMSDFTFTFHFHALEKEMATHSSVLAWRIPGTGEPGGLPSLGSHRVRHD